jgi:hypothetical protein
LPAFGETLRFPNDIYISSFIMLSEFRYMFSLCSLSINFITSTALKTGFWGFGVLG